ncbi:DUF6883 domain-containing protein [Kluyvera ascorbata]|uniref:DUF6883 domain-containing protein n=1 Tax=Kluyvera ascorbata TaxID=51288 RepID=UPI002AB91941|nr:DUF6883 domain-containing protein [Kluyvera ascorbata]MDZ4031535.1 hypothetical protein [Kluyvera ascorbata]
MFTLYMRWDAERELAPGDIQYILSPRDALDMASIFYELDYLEYDQRGRILPHSLPKRRRGVYHRFAAQPYKRKRLTEYDGLYDDVKWNLDHGWMVGVDTQEKWDHFRNPFYFDDDSNLIYDCFMDTYSEGFQQAVRQIYEYSLSEHQGRKPSPTIKHHYSDVPILHAQAGKTINSKAAGRLLAAGGIYNGNVEGFHQTAQQLGGDAPAGYDQVMDNKGLLITAASVAAGLAMGRINVAGELEELSTFSKIPTFESPALRGFISESGTLLNAEHAVVDYRKLSTYSLNPTHPSGGHKARVFQSALGYSPTNADVLGLRVQEGVLSAPAKMLDPINFGQKMAVDIPILGVNGETAIVRTGWIYETDSLVPRLTTIFVK